MWPFVKLVEYRILELQMAKYNRENKKGYSAELVAENISRIRQRREMTKEYGPSPPLTENIMHMARVANANQKTAAYVVALYAQGDEEIDSEPEDKNPEEEELEEEELEEEKPEDENPEKEEPEPTEREATALRPETPSQKQTKAAKDSYTVSERTRLQEAYKDSKLLGDTDEDKYTDGTYTFRNSTWTKEVSEMTLTEGLLNLFINTTVATYAKVTISTALSGERILQWDHNKGTLSHMFTAVSDNTDKLLPGVLQTMNRYNQIALKIPAFAVKLERKGIDLKYLKDTMQQLGKKALAHDMVKAMENRGLSCQ